MMFHNFAWVISKKIVDKDYAGLEGLTSGVRLSAQMMREAVGKYGRVITMPSQSDLAKCIDIVECEGLGRRAWSVRFPLWTIEEGRSDLSIECTVYENGDGSFGLELDDIRVL